MRKKILLPLLAVVLVGCSHLSSDGRDASSAVSNNKNYQQGYQKGRSDGVKQLYWNLQNQQRP